MNKLYEMIIDNPLTDAIFAISLVDTPAVEEDFILLSKENKINIELKLDKLTDKKRKVLTGVVLIPDKIIPRDGYDIVFSKETVRNLSENYMIEGHMNNITLQHKKPVNKVKMIENWIVEDPENDKAKALGFNVPKGTWLASFKILDDDLWSEFLESGILKGFSLEGQFSSRELNLTELPTYPPEAELDDDDKQVLLNVMYSPSDLNDFYIWRVSTKDNNCPSCKGFDRKIKPLKEWLKIAIPAVKNGTKLAGETCTFPHSPYGTYCEDACNCTLTKVRRAAIRSPFR